MREIRESLIVDYKFDGVKFYIKYRYVRNSGNESKNKDKACSRSVKIYVAANEV